MSKAGTTASVGQGQEPSDSVRAFFFWRRRLGVDLTCQAQSAAIRVSWFLRFQQGAFVFNNLASKLFGPLRSQLPRDISYRLTVGTKCLREYQGAELLQARYMHTEAANRANKRVQSQKS